MKFLILFFLFFAFEQASSQFFNNINSGSPSCLVTGNKLFSHGNYIRDLREEENDQIKTYKQEIAEFQKKLNEAFSIKNFLTNNTTLSSIPTRPNLPAFCTGNETTLFILGSCTIQNHKVYVTGKFARDLNEEEKVRLNEFAARLTNNRSSSSTSQSTIKIDDFCHEF